MEYKDMFENITSALPTTVTISAEDLIWNKNSAIYLDSAKSNSITASYIEPEVKVEWVETVKEHDLGPNDLIIFNIKTEDWNVSDIHNLWKVWQEAIPDHDIAVLPYGIDLDIIHREKNEKEVCW